MPRPPQGLPVRDDGSQPGNLLNPDGTWRVDRRAPPDVRESIAAKTEPPSYWGWSGLKLVEPARQRGPAAPASGSWPDKQKYPARRATGCAGGTRDVRDYGAAL